MIYIDSSVLLARVFAEAVSPPESFWENALTSSRLLVYEVWTRVHARNSRLSLRDDIEMLLDHVELIALDNIVLDRAIQPFPISLRTLDALHLATIDFLRRQGQEMLLASYDRPLLSAAAALGIEAAAL